MLRNYFKTAWRNLVKNRFYTVINISGLAVGLAIGILILLWVQDEFSFDGFHANTRNIYKLENMVGTGSSRQLWTQTASAIGVLAKKNIPSVQDEVRITYNGNYGLYKYGNKVFTEQNAFYADPSLFSVFDFKLIKGNSANPFPDFNSIVITEKTAKKYFGNEDAIGKTITADDKINLKVSGVIKDLPKNSSIQGDMFFSMDLLEKDMYAGNKDGRNLSNDFYSYSYNTFLLMKPGTSLTGLTDKLRQLHLGVKSDDTDIGYVLLPLEKMHLYRSDGSDGGLAAVRMFIIIAVLILVIACINYVNLSTARSMLRAKEISLRKIVGAARLQLFMQFIIETALLFVFATAIALALVYFLMPYFNEISGKELIVNFADYHIWQIIFVAIFGTLIISSIYPAMLLSSFEPLKALKGKMSAKISDALFRKVLVVVQFSFSVILITGTIIIGKQLSYVRSMQLGYDKDHVLSVHMINMRKHYDAVKADLIKQPGILDITSADVDIVDYGGQTGDNNWDGKQPGETLMLSPIGVDKDFIPFFKMKMAEGSAFTGAVSDSVHFILNETAVKAARLTNPVGHKFTMHGINGTIIGVAKDFHFTSMREKIQPAIFYYRPSGYYKIYLKTTGADAPKAIAAVQTEWKKYNAGFDFEYTFLDDEYNNLYKSESRTDLLYNIFAGIAIFISCLGLFGLAAYTAQVRTREIGVRKVLGASISGIIQLLALDFIKLIMIAILIAAPVSWYVMNKWLQDFAYKINIGWTVFVLAGFIAILIAVMTISFQAIKAALANPVKSLRTE
ncbi:MAG TPA: ABC transporter permease [Puia sp.]|jgi:putative ABC transport system permease protein|nr:ABC transporter permease [Puia sp.]